MIQIKNLQNLKRINKVRIRQRIPHIFQFLRKKNLNVSLVFCDNDFIRKLNKKYFKRNRTTDVIAFNLRDAFVPGYLGEIVISVEQALTNAVQFRTSFDAELFLYVIHGILHLVGYTDSTARQRRKMEEKQAEILNYIRSRE